MEAHPTACRDERWGEQDGGGEPFPFGGGCCHSDGDGVDVGGDFGANGGATSEVTLTAPPPPVVVEEERETELPASPGGGPPSSSLPLGPKASEEGVAEMES